MSRIHRSKLRLVSLAVAVVATALCAGPTVTASALAAPPAVRIDDPVAVLGAMAPELLAETRLPATAQQRAAIRQQGGGAAFDAVLPGDAHDPVRLSPTETDGAGLPVSITMDDARGDARTEQGITVYAEGASGGQPASGAATSAAYVQPVANGVRMLTALADVSAGTDFGYTLDVPAGSTTVALPTGDTVVLDPAGHYVVTLGEAWARDARGTELATGYTWGPAEHGTGLTLTQHVEVTPGTAFPVLVDPTWYYTYDFSVTSTGWPANHPKASEAAVSRLLRGCFNCYFPIFGAPHDYPADGQVLPLNASPFTLTATAAPVKVQTANGGALQFVAQPGHFDGAGSMVTFAWYNDTSGYIHLFVHAMVKNDYGAAGDVVMARAAGAAWLIYWKRVADSANGSSGGGGV